MYYAAVGDAALQKAEIEFNYTYNHLAELSGLPKLTPVPATIQCPGYCETEEQAVDYLTKAGFRSFKLYKRVDQFLGEYAPEERPVVKKVNQRDGQSGGPGPVGV